LRCSPLPANREKPKAATSFAGLTLALHYPVCEKLLCPAPFTALPVFPGFFPKLLCGRRQLIHVAQNKPFGYPHQPFTTETCRRACDDGSYFVLMIPRLKSDARVGENMVMRRDFFSGSKRAFTRASISLSSSFPAGPVQSQQRRVSKSIFNEPR